MQGSPGAEGLAVAPEGPYDFYQQSNMSEARLCLPVLRQLGVAVRRRLEEWPEHPALVQVSQPPGGQRVSESQQLRLQDSFFAN